jgi:hypothetical protein
MPEISVHGPTRARGAGSRAGHEIARMAETFGVTNVKASRMLQRLAPDPRLEAFLRRLKLPA